MSRALCTAFGGARVGSGRRSDRSSAPGTVSGPRSGTHTLDRLSPGACGTRSDQTHTRGGRTPALLAVLALALALAAPAVARADASADLEEGSRAYERGDFKQAIELVRPLLYPTIRLTAQPQVIEAHKLLGISYVFEKRSAEAAREFLAILSIRPDYRLDPLVDPVSAVQLFEQVKKRNAEKIRAILERERREAERRRLEEERRKAEERRLKLLAGQGRVVVERNVVEHPYWVSFLPLGAGQFQNGHRRKGWALFGTELGLAAVSVGTYLGGYFAYSGRPLTQEEYDRGRVLSVVQVASAGLCAAVAAYGIIDALIYHKPQTVTERRYKRPPAAGARETSKTSLFVVPSFSADGESGGLGLGITF